MPKLLPPPTDPILAELHAERRRRGLTLQQLAELLGRHTYQSVWQWERGISDLKVSNLRAWAAVLGYDVTLTRRAEVPP